MTTRDDSPETECATRAALHALGALSPGEARDYADHLAGCALCRDDVDALSGVVTALGALAPAVEPPRDLKERLFRRVHELEASASEAFHRRAVRQVWKQWPAEAGAAAVVTVPAAGAGWESTDVPGIDVRRLFVDPAADRVTMLVRMAPGTSYPAHRHGGVEECFVIEGELKVGDDVLHAGDYQRCDLRSVHVVQSTDTGCLLFIVSSMHDELLPGPP